MWPFKRKYTEPTEIREIEHCLAFGTSVRRPSSDKRLFVVRYNPKASIKEILTFCDRYGVPKIGDDYDANSPLKCRERKLEVVGAGVYLITCRYEVLG